MQTDPWKILLVEDDEDDVILTRTLLSEARETGLALHWADSYEAALELLQTEDLDVVLADYALGAYTGLDLVREAAVRERRIPIILLTGNGNYEVDLEAMKAGAADYLSKGEVTARTLERTIRYAIERQRTQEALRQANEQLAASNRLLAQAKDELELRVLERTEALRQANDQLIQKNAELAETQRRLIDSLEAERLQLAQDLHDGPMQELYGLTYQVEALRNGLSEDALDQWIKSFRENIQQVIHNLRATAGELRPPALTPYGLEKAIRSHVEQIHVVQPDLQVSLDLMPDGKLLSERVRLAMFRIYQISMTNVIRHAKARHVDIRLRLDSHEVVLEIQDDGQGFRLPRRWIEMVRQGHLGLAGAFERSEAVGGVFQIESEPGKGTLARVTVPLVRESQDLAQQVVLPLPGVEGG